MLIVKLVTGVIAPVVIFGTLLFLPAGTLDWLPAWVFLGVIFACGTGTMIGVFRNNEELLDERYKGPTQKGQPLADKIIANLFVLSFLGVILLIPLDVFRFHLMGAPGPVVSFAGLVLFVAGWVLISVAFRENSFAAPVVKHQEERNQTVVDTGVYATVRHPMYTSVFLLLVGMALWLGSYAAALLAIVPIALIAVRIVFEERFLRRELPGYEAYTRKV
ncbi:MAG TPA: isoprenylcysteine carboxylmethyltransferase family protein [Candidatus Binataceae bacterium]